MLPAPSGNHCCAQSAVPLAFRSQAKIQSCRPLLLSTARRLLPSLARPSMHCKGTIDPEALTDRNVPISELQKQLEAAVDNEDYAVAAQLRDEIDRRRFDNRLGVEEANDAFYSAFQTGNLKAMGEIWGQGEQVQCVHPSAGCIAGRTSVMESWKLILGSGRMTITLEDVRIYATENEGFVTCVEVVDAGDTKGRIVATNVFEKQGGKWKIVHHHGSRLPGLRG